MSFIWLSLIIITALNVAGFTFGFLAQSDKATDILYSLSFAVAVGLMAFLQPDMTLTQWIAVGMVLVWAFRLGSYLFYRIHKMGKDARFDDMRPSMIRLAGFWTLQILTVWIVLFPVSYILQGEGAEGLLPVQIIALLLWITGFSIESVADSQKFSFRQDPQNKGRFMNQGLWGIVRHPNYTGEILCWWAVFLYCLPFLELGGLWTIASPIWISLMLIKVSGIPLLEESAEKRYGALQDFQDWKSGTKRLFPGIW